jgi:hypothetical protein
MFSGMDDIDEVRSAVRTVTEAAAILLCRGHGPPSIASELRDSIEAVIQEPDPIVAENRRREEESRRREETPQPPLSVDCRTSLLSE